jgi:hypothetical protein
MLLSMRNFSVSGRTKSISRGCWVDGQGGADQDEDVGRCGQSRGGPDLGHGFAEPDDVGHELTAVFGDIAEMDVAGDDRATFRGCSMP